MKKNFVIYACAALALCGQTACSDFLEEDTRGKVFSNVLAEQSGLESALTGAYTGWSSTWAYGFTNGWATETTTSCNTSCKNTGSAIAASST